MNLETQAPCIASVASKRGGLLPQHPSRFIDQRGQAITRDNRNQLARHPHTKAGFMRGTGGHGFTEML